MCDANKPFFGAPSAAKMVNHLIIDMPLPVRCREGSTVIIMNYERGVME